MRRRRRIQVSLNQNSLLDPPAYCPFRARRSDDGHKLVTMAGGLSAPPGATRLHAQSIKILLFRTLIPLVTHHVVIVGFLFSAAWRQRSVWPWPTSRITNHRFSGRAIIICFSLSSCIKSRQNRRRWPLRKLGLPIRPLLRSARNFTNPHLFSATVT